MTVEELAGWGPWLAVAVLAAALWYGKKRREWSRRNRRKLPLCVHGHEWDKCPVCREG